MLPGKGVITVTVAKLISARSKWLYWQIKYISRLEYLWGDIRKGVVEIPDFVVEHDKILEHRPLTDYGIEHDPLHLTDVPAVGYSLGRYENESGLLKIDGILKITFELFCCSQRRT
ncbi:uncharacterized protein LOC120677402 [Panicum virgatum]|uniref:Uncharacterized protein n=1 Tax=Panicum virgatum TaxID=38727 RepID=A0A8T0QZN6_PANVG|nr:uncharacterized protein LOC120677402 [Panicum virgatum]KAG2578405.1 hypothetical protein PVAP13_6NG108500 [Panicum virgatum]